MDNNPTLDDFDNLCDELGLNVYSGYPDLSCLPFLKENFPYLVCRPEPTSWTIYPPGPDEIPKRSIRSVHIELHPFIKTSHNRAKIDFLTQEWTNDPVGIEQIRSWIYFATRL